MLAKTLVLVCAAICLTHAASIKWTGLEQNNQWTSPVNWSPAQVPGPNDDVTIETGNVLVTIATGVSSLTMGTSVVGPANLTIFDSFAVGSSMEVQANGNLIINAGSASLSGQVNIDGHLSFKSGTIGGEITISSRGTADLTSQATKNLIGVAFTNQGKMTLSGVVGFNQSSIFKNTGTITMTDSTQLMANDKTMTSFDSSKGLITYSGNSHNLRFMVASTVGVFSIESGNIEVFNTVTFADNLTLPSGTILTTDGDATVVFAKTVSGAGSINSASSSSTYNGLNISAFTVAGGNAIFSAPSTTDKLSLTGGVAQLTSALTSNSISISGGILQGAGGLVGVKSISLDTAGLNLNSTITSNGKMTVAAKSLISFNSQGAIVIASSGSLDVASALSLTGPSGSAGLTNNGAASISAALSTQNINIQGSGSYTVAGSITTSTCSFAAGTITLGGGSVTGSNTNINVQAVAAASGSVDVRIGSYTLACSKECTNVQAKDATSSFSFSNKQ